MSLVCTYRHPRRMGRRRVFLVPFGGLHDGLECCNADSFVLGVGCANVASDCPVGTTKSPAWRNGRCSGSEAIDCSTNLCQLSQIIEIYKLSLFVVVPAVSWAMVVLPTSTIAVALASVAITVGVRAWVAARWTMGPLRERSDWSGV